VPEVERVVERHEGYWVVEKLGKAGELTRSSTSARTNRPAKGRVDSERAAELHRGWLTRPTRIRGSSRSPPIDGPRHQGHGCAGVMGFSTAVRRSLALWTAWTTRVVVSKG
jgi:hypothetical protein